MHPNTIFFYILNYYDTLYGKNDVTKIIYYTEFYSGFNEQAFKLIGLVVEKLLMCLILVSKLLIVQVGGTDLVTGRRQNSIILVFADE